MPPANKAGTTKRNRSIGALLEIFQPIARGATAADEEQALEAQPTGAQEGVAAASGGAKYVSRNAKRRWMGKQRRVPHNEHRAGERVGCKVTERLATLLSEEFA
jgi:hypothetical protein